MPWCCQEFSQVIKTLPRESVKLKKIKNLPLPINFVVPVVNYTKKWKNNIKLAPAKCRCPLANQANSTSAVSWTDEILSSPSLNSTCPKQAWLCWCQACEGSKRIPREPTDSGECNWKAQRLSLGHYYSHLTVRMVNQLCSILQKKKKKKWKKLHLQETTRWFRWPTFIITWALSHFISWHGFLCCFNATNILMFLLLLERADNLMTDESYWKALDMPSCVCMHLCRGWLYIPSCHSSH